MPVGDIEHPYVFWVSHWIIYLTKSFTAITDLTILQYYLLFSTVIFTHHSNTPSYYFVAVSRAERVHSRAGTVAAVQSVCVSGYKSMTACMLHYGFNRSIEWQVAVCASCLLSHSHIRDSTHMQSVSISDSLCLSCHLCCSLAGGLLFFLQRWASEDWCWELCHSVGARLCHPEITYTLWFLLILYSGHVPSPLNEISHTFRKVWTKRSATLLLLICVQVQVIFVTYMTIQRLYNQQWNVSKMHTPMPW